MGNKLTEAYKEIKKAEEFVRGLAREAINNNEFEVATKLFPIIEKLVILQSSKTPSPKEMTVNLTTKTTAIIQDDTYPKFSKLGNYLNRTGWSKKHKKEYNQRIDYKYVELVVPKFLEIARKKESFEMTEFLPMVKENGKRVKDYKTYFVISWLRKLGVVEHHGDYGYCLGTDDDVRAIVKKEWEELPKKRSK